MNDGRNELQPAGLFAEGRWASWLFRHRRGVLTLVLLLTAVSGLLATRLDYDFTPQALFSGENELVAYSEQVKATFGHSENIVIVVLRAEGEADCLALAALRWQVKFAQTAAKLPAVERIDSLATMRLPRPRVLGRTGLMFVPVVRGDALETDSTAADESLLVRQKVDDQPLLEGTFISEDRRLTALVLHLDPKRKDIDHVTAVVNQVQALVDQSAVPDGYEAFLGGLPAMRVAIVEGLKRDQTTIIPLAALVFALVQIVIFRSWTGVLVSAVAVAAGLAWTMAALVLLGQSLTIISNVLPILLMIVGVSSCVHFLNEYAEQLERTPGDAPGAAVRTTQRITLACLLTSLTTALGFLSLLAARSQLLGKLGWQAAMGIGLFFVATVLVCSALLPLHRPAKLSTDSDEFDSGTSGSRKSGSGGTASPLARVAWAFGSWAIRWPRLTVFLGVGLLALTGIVGRNTVINSTLLETFDEQHPQTRQMRLIEEELGGFVPMEIVLSADNPVWFLKAQQWQNLLNLEQGISQLDGVLRIRSVTELLEEVDRRLPAGPQLAELARNDTDKLEQRLQECYRLLKKTADLNSLQRFVTKGGGQLRLLMSLRDVGTQGGLRLADEIRELLDQTFRDSPGSGVTTSVTSNITGESYVAAVALTRFIRDLLLSLLGVSALIFLVIGLVLRSPRLGLLSILPNVAPLVVTLGYLGLRGYTINMSNVIVFAISLGVAVDDTIHFLARFRHEAQVESDVTTAIRRTSLGTGRAVLMTTILIVCGMAILLLSSFVPTRRFAELAAVTMCSALLGDLLLLPAMLKLFWPSTNVDAELGHG